MSGGGVLDQRGDLVGIPIGRMQGDYRFSFILPIRAEMLRKLPTYEQPEPAPHAAARRPALTEVTAENAEIAKQVISAVSATPRLFLSSI